MIDRRTFLAGLGATAAVAAAAAPVALMASEAVPVGVDVAAGLDETVWTVSQQTGLSANWRVLAVYRGGPVKVHDFVDLPGFGEWSDEGLRD